MNIIIGHTNMDLDCIGSMVLARYLYPGYKLVGSHRIHPVARNLYNLYKNHLDFMPAKDLKNHNVENIVVVDTRNEQRISEYMKHMPGFSGKIEVFDHHPVEESNIKNAIIYDSAFGSNTTLLGLKIMEQNITISQEDATIALVGIYADTGNFVHPTVTIEDFQVASYLLSNNASLKLVKKFLHSLKEEHQITIMHDLINQLQHKKFQGHQVLFSYMELEQQVGGLAAVVEKVFELENSDAIFAVFYFEKQNEVLIIARSQKDSFEVNRVLAAFGGGGHIHAASALLKNMTGTHVINNLQKYLNSSIMPAIKAKDLMVSQVKTINEKISLKEASIILENINHTGAPVLNDQSEMVGFLTLRNIMKGRKVNQMHAPVKAYMTKKVIVGNLDMNMHDIEKIFYNNNIGHLPIIHANRLVGILTRTDILNHMSQRDK